MDSKKNSIKKTDIAKNNKCPNYTKISFDFDCVIYEKIGGNGDFFSQNQMFHKMSGKGTYYTFSVCMIIKKRKLIFHPMLKFSNFLVLMP